VAHDVRSFFSFTGFTVHHSFSVTFISPDSRFFYSTVNY
jgi:hypothetical protein